jgi:AcrR family transcriptional regulator
MRRVDEAAVRSRERDSEATRRAILDAAERLLASGGEEQVSIRELCLRAGVSPPTIYHHFGDKAALVDRVVDDCFAAFDRYVEYGLAHPTHYRLMFARTRRRPTPAGIASYDRLRRTVGAIEAEGRLRAPLEPATAAFWSGVHGVTSLLIAGFWQADSPAIALVRDSLIAQLTDERHMRKRPHEKRAGAGNLSCDPPTRSKKGKNHDRS